MSADPPVPGAPRVLPAAALTGPLTIDGRLDEEAWAAAPVATDFRQYEPDEGAPASRRTEVRVLYGPTALYVGAVLHDDPALIRRPLTRRDEVGDADLFLVALDGYGTGRTAYLFGVTAAGVQIDGVLEGGSSDASWDAVWDAAVRVTPEGWTLEMAIPYSMLRFNAADEQAWWVQFQRVISRNREEVFWQPVTREEQGVGFIAGRLTGLAGLSPRTNVQVRPYTVSRLTRAPEGPGTYGQQADLDVGADLKIGLGANLFLDATVNPDFGQVEADPAVLNLTTFETFFPERRPFFLEGTSIFDYGFAPGDGPLLYTRRVGGAGRIVGAGKLTGRSRGGVSFGALAAATSDGFVGGEGGPVPGEGFTPDLLYGAARVKGEFGDRSFVGAAVSLFDGRGSAFDGYRVASVVAGTDWDVRLAQGTYRFDGALTGSRAVAAGDLGWPDETGFALYTGLDKLRGTLTGGLGLRVYSDGFNPNDVGYFVWDDVIRTRIGASLLLNGGRPFGAFRLARASLNGQNTWTFRDRTNLGGSLQARTDWFLKNFHRVDLRLNFVPIGGVDVRESRGMGPVANVAGAAFGVDYTTDARRRLVLYPRGTFGLFEDGATAWNVSLGMDWTASDRLALSLTTRYEQRDDVQAWVANEAFRRDAEGYAVGGAPNRSPYGQGAFHRLVGDPTGFDALFAGLPVFADGGGVSDYYAAVFGARDQRSLDTSVRATYALRPNLSFQAYSQLFAARYRYDGFRLLAGPDDLRPLEGYPRRRDQANHSLLLNAVARWEYRPGSTVYLVWAHNRLGFDGGYRLHDPEAPSPFDRGTLRLASDTFSLMPTDVFLVKLSYLLMR